jgi:hypothetical protein
MNLGGALDALKEGKRVALPGGNPDIWLVLVPGSTITVTEGRPLGIAAPELVGQQVQYCAHIDIHGTDGTLQPWGGPGTHHLFADDWEVLD